MSTRKSLLSQEVPNNFRVLSLFNNLVDALRDAKMACNGICFLSKINKVVRTFIQMTDLNKIISNGTERDK